jgi:hypothetical protein
MWVEVVNRASFLETGFGQERRVQAKRHRPEDIASQIDGERLTRGVTAWELFR